MDTNPEETVSIIRKRGPKMKPAQIILCLSRLNGAARFTNLRGADLRGADLRGADLAHAKLNGATLIDADLSLASLSYANLNTANLCSARLCGANLHRTKLGGVILHAAILLDTYRHFKRAPLLVRKLAIIGACTEAIDWVWQANESASWRTLFEAAPVAWVEWLQQELWEDGDLDDYEYIIKGLEDIEV